MELKGTEILLSTLALTQSLKPHLLIHFFNHLLYFLLRQLLRNSQLETELNHDTPHRLSHLPAPHLSLLLSGPLQSDMVPLCTALINQEAKLSKLIFQGQLSLDRVATILHNTPVDIRNCTGNWEKRKGGGGGGRRGWEERVGGEGGRRGWGEGGSK